MVAAVLLRRKTMRKILLTTTALVALGGVSAASADISISGAASYNYTTGTGGSFTADDHQWPQP